MPPVLAAPKVVLLAAQAASRGDIDSLAFLAARYDTVLRKDLLLRLILTYLPGTVKTADYVSFLEEIQTGEFTDIAPRDIDASTVEHLSDDAAAKKVRKLRLKKLALPELQGEETEEQPLAAFLVQRAREVDDSVGALAELPELILPFLDTSDYLRTWMVSTLLPLYRRNFEYYPENPIPQSLSAFETLNDRVAVIHLLSQTGVQPDGTSSVGRDLRGLVGPWLYNEHRWTSRKKEKPQMNGDASTVPLIEHSLCPGWEQVLQWLTIQATRSWKVAVAAVMEWDGPADVDLGGYSSTWLDDDEQRYLEQRYARTALASAYLIPEASADALEGAYSIATKIMGLLDGPSSPDIQTAASLLSPVQPDSTEILSSKNTTHLRNDLLDESNTLTKPFADAAALLQALAVSAYLLTISGDPCTVRRAGELVLLQDEREQREEAIKMIRSISTNGPTGDDTYWVRTRNEILWLRDWGAEEVAGSGASATPTGVFGQVSKELLEIEFLKALLARTRYAVAKTLYEDSPQVPLSQKALSDTVVAAALNAYDNASNPNRTRGGMKKCDEIIHAFPKSLPKSCPETQRIEALLKATHILSNYRLVLKQGEPFTPVVLRVHHDPIAIIQKVLEQNPKSYTDLQEMVNLGINMVNARLTIKDNNTSSNPPDPAKLAAHKVIAEKRITAMCIEAALNEDDFETAYSYVVSRLGSSDNAQPLGGLVPADEWSWKAALQAGKYRRTAQTIRPTHLGTASGNPEIRHLEQRIECLSAALRIAPTPTLQEILNSYRRCEEELDAAIKVESAQESAWDDAGDAAATNTSNMPGGFRTSPGPHGVLTARAAAASGSSAGRAPPRAADEAPLSLFDLSRAAARAAQRNVTALSNLQRSGQTRIAETPDGGGEATDAASAQERVRKRDQFANAATGVLTSGVGWLIGAPAADRRSGGQGGGE